MCAAGSEGCSTNVCLADFSLFIVVRGNNISPGVLSIWTN